MVSDELVEAAARAILAAELWPGAWDKANETERGHVLHKARAALAAIIPAIQAEERERATADERKRLFDLIASNVTPEHLGDGALDRGRRIGMQDAAMILARENAAIRAMGAPAADQKTE